MIAGFTASQRAASVVLDPCTAGQDSVHSNLRLFLEELATKRESESSTSWDGCILMK